MQRVDYWKFSGFEYIYLEDSYVLKIETGPMVEIIVEAVLRDSHPLYEAPKPGEQYCYRTGKIIFPLVRNFHWVKKNMVPTIDPDGSADYGNIDEFYLLDGAYRILGQWGELNIESEPPYFEVVRQ